MNLLPRGATNSRETLLKYLKKTTKKLVFTLKNKVCSQGGGGRWGEQILFAHRRNESFPLRVALNRRNANISVQHFLRDNILASCFLELRSAHQSHREQIPIPFRADPFSVETSCAGKQIGRHKKLFPL